MPIIVTPKNAARSCFFIIFASISPSGMDMVTVAVMKASAVPIGIPLPTNASIIGTTSTEFA